MGQRVVTALWKPLIQRPSFAELCKEMVEDDRSVLAAYWLSCVPFLAPIGSLMKSFAPIGVHTNRSKGLDLKP